METSSNVSSLNDRKKSSGLVGEETNLGPISAADHERVFRRLNFQKVNPHDLSDSHQQVAPETPSDRQHFEISSSPPKAMSPLRALLFAAVCIVFAATGAVVTQSHEEGGVYYFYFVESADSQANNSPRGVIMLRERREWRWLVCLTQLVRAKEAIFALREALGEFRVFTLFLVLWGDILIATVPTAGSMTRKHVFAFVLLAVLLCQLYYSIIYGGVVGNLPWDEKYVVWICFTYPVAIGLFKMAVNGKVQSVIDEHYFDSGDLLEIISFGLADLPYRFIYFGFDKWATALMLMGIKYTYKVGTRQIYGYWVIILLRRVVAFFSLKVRKREKKEPGKKFFPVPGNSKVFEEPEFLREMAMKFFMQEIIDSFDLLSVLLILAVTRAGEFGFGSQFPSWQYEQISLQILVEYGLEMAFAGVTVTIGAVFLRENQLRILALVGTAYPLVFLLVTVFKGDIAVLLIDQVR